jgi:hypothetical protein
MSTSDLQHQLDRIEKKLDALGRAVAALAAHVAAPTDADAATLTERLKESAAALAASVASAWQPIPVEPVPGHVS